MTPIRPVPENPAWDLVLLASDHEVVVTGEEHHQHVLAHYTPMLGGRPRQFAFALRPAPVSRGPHAGMPGMEVWLNGARVGELTYLMAQRYGPMVEEVQRHGGCPGCLGRVENGPSGPQVVLRLPDPRGRHRPIVPTGAGVGVLVRWGRSRVRRLTESARAGGGTPAP